MAATMTKTGNTFFLELLIFTLSAKQPLIECFTSMTAASLNISHVKGFTFAERRNLPSRRDRIWHFRQGRCLFILLLLLAGDVESNPGPGKHQSAHVVSAITLSPGHN
ncbi:hypothetical protein DPMN_029039 [Dreissena polymorpha]|uniref:Secreted protein n=1 Tax=Dreissena polymorpha TaxID=45954 RepID=A0A9D4M015_DREPO|nr:hypothetical protein DPMN_028899 [Dreissena polymorpha]KAH3865991.1 hypothetical protein DPMN_029039 [Dreissena polymorpha]